MTSSQTIGLALCELVGIDPHTVSEISITANVSDVLPVVRVTVIPRRPAPGWDGSQIHKEYSVKLRRRGRVRLWWWSLWRG